MAKKNSKHADSPEKIIDRVREQDVLKDLIRSKKSEFIAMITTRGLKQTIYSEELISDQVTLEDLFKEV